MPCQNEAFSVVNLKFSLLYFLFVCSFYHAASHPGPSLNVSHVMAKSSMRADFTTGIAQILWLMLFQRLPLQPSPVSTSTYSNVVVPACLLLVSLICFSFSILCYRLLVDREVDDLLKYTILIETKKTL